MSAGSAKWAIYRPENSNDLGFYDATAERMRIQQTTGNVGIATTSPRYLLDVWGDVFGVILMVGLVIALVRRYVIRSKQLDTVLKDTVAIVLLSIIVVTGFMCEAFRLMDPQYASVAAFSSL